MESTPGPSSGGDPPCPSPSPALSSAPSLSSLASSAPPDRSIFYSMGHSDRLLQGLQSQRAQARLCDVTLVAGSEVLCRVRAHRVVLAAASDYFSAMFTTELAESEQDEVHLHDIDPDTLQQLLTYIYIGKLELSEDSVESLLAAACLLQLCEVISACCDFLSKQLHPSNCIGIHAFADRQGCAQLTATAWAYTCEHFSEVIRNQEFLLLPPDGVSSLLLCDDLNVLCEEVAFQALTSWISHDVESRKRYLSTLLATIRLPLLPPQYLADHVQQNLMFKEDCMCQELVIEALNYHLLPERRYRLHSPRARPRKSTVGLLYAVGGSDAGKNTASIERYDVRRDVWSQVGNMNMRRLQFGVAVIDDKIYIVGGRDGLKTLNAVECYDTRKKCWQAVPPMSTHRHGLGVAVLQGPLYAVGGHDGWSFLNTVERWDPQVRLWSYVAPMSTARSTAGVATLNGRLYVVGGRDGSSCLRTVEVFDPHTNRWSQVPPMSRRRGGVSVATCHGYLYAVGGHDPPLPAPPGNSSSGGAGSGGRGMLGCGERYDPRVDQWVEISAMSSPRDSLGLCLVGDCLYAVGGFDGTQCLDTVEQYDPTTNLWRKVSPLCMPRAAVCVVCVKSEKSSSTCISRKV